MSGVNEEVDKIFGNSTISYTNTIKNQSFDDSIANKDYKNIKFCNCKFSDLSIQNCSFIDCSFEYCQFNTVSIENVSFENCNYYVVELDFVLLQCVIKTSNLFEVKITNDYPFGGLEYSEIDDIEDWGFIENDFPKTDRINNFRMIDSEMLSVEFDNINLNNALFERVSFQMVMFKNKTRISTARFNNPKGYFDISFDNSEINVLSAVMNELTVFPNYAQVKKINDFSSIKGFMNYCKSYHEYDVLDTMMRHENYKTPDWINECLVVKTFRGIKLLLQSFKEDKLSSYKNHTGTYFDIANQFKQNGFESKYGEYYYIAKRFNHKTLRGHNKFTSFLANITCGYGEKWLNGILTSLFIIAFSSFIYMLNGLNVTESYTINYHFINNINQLHLIDWDMMLSDYWDCLYFSMMTFTTVGYGNMEAASFVSEFVSFIQMFIGVILIAITTGSLLRKLFR